MESNQKKLEAAQQSGDQEAVNKAKLTNAVSFIPALIITPLACIYGMVDAIFTFDTPGRRWTEERFPDANAPGLKPNNTEVLQLLPFGPQEDDLPLIESPAATTPKGKEPATQEASDLRQLPTYTSLLSLVQDEASTSRQQPSFTDRISGSYTASPNAGRTI